MMSQLCKLYFAFVVRSIVNIFRQVCWNRVGGFFPRCVWLLCLYLPAFVERTCSTLFYFPFFRAVFFPATFLFLLLSAASESQWNTFSNNGKKLQKKLNLVFNKKKFLRNSLIMFILWGLKWRDYNPLIKPNHWWNFRSKTKKLNDKNVSQKAQAILVQQMKWFPMNYILLMEKLSSSWNGKTQFDWHAWLNSNEDPSCDYLALVFVLTNMANENPSSSI